MAIKVNSNTAIDDSKDGYFRNISVKNIVYTYGYAAGGTYSPQDQIERFPFSSPFITATLVGYLYYPRNSHMGCSSSTTGYCAGGYQAVTPPYGTVASRDEFPFTTSFTTATAATDLPAARDRGGAASSDTNGYIFGGYVNGSPYFLDILTFPFASPSTISSLGNLAQYGTNRGGHNSSTDGYASGGSYPPVGFYTQIDKFPFSTPSPLTATDVGDLSSPGRSGHGSNSSDTDGYTTGGVISTPSTEISQIDKFPFSSPWPGTATDAGDLSAIRSNIAGISSVNNGYTAGGGSTPGPSWVQVNIIEQFPFSSPFTSVTDTGNLTYSQMTMTGHQG